MEQYELDIVKTIWDQLRGTTHWSVLFSWGISKKVAMKFENMPALALKVSGFIHKGWAVIAYDDCTDTYKIIICKGRGALPTNPVETIEDVYFDEMGKILDEKIERGTCSKDEYHKKIDDWTKTL